MYKSLVRADCTRNDINVFRITQKNIIIYSKTNLFAVMIMFYFYAETVLSATV